MQKQIHKISQKNIIICFLPILELINQFSINRTIIHEQFFLDGPTLGAFQFLLIMILAC